MFVKRPLRLFEGDKRVFLLPSKEFKITYTIDFDHPLLRKQSFTWVFSDTTFVKEIAKARTFGFLEEVEQLRSTGLAQGGSLDNAVVIGDYNILNEDGLRYDNEFVRHKILDLLGDLSVLGTYILGHFKVFKSGHHLNHIFVDKILSNLNRFKAFTPSDSKDSAYQKQKPALQIFRRASA